MEFLFSPPVLFVLFLLLSLFTMRTLAAYEKSGGGQERTVEPYACGQQDYENYFNPNYTQFFRYAFVFSIMHVLALVITTAGGELLLPLAYVGAGLLALAIIFRP